MTDNDIAHRAAKTAVSLDLAAALAERDFGVIGRVSTLSGERDENFLIETPAGKYVLKITHPDENRGSIAFQTHALRHVEVRDPELPTPRVLLTRDGRLEVDFFDTVGAARTARLLSFLPGNLLAGIAVTPDLRATLGRMLARFDRALEDFSHPADSVPLKWDLCRAPDLRPMLSGIAGLVDRANVERALDKFETVLAPVLPKLRQQVIHNDMTPFNVLVSEANAITGILDFGDLIRAPLANDLAICCAYHIARRGDPLAPVLEIVAAYHEGNPLLREECDLVFDLMSVRLAITVLITEWNAARAPENRAYLLKNHPAAVTGLVRLGTIARADAQRRLRNACGMES